MILVILLFLLILMPEIIFLSAIITYLRELIRKR